jgi:hypothetical protein
MSAVPSVIGIAAAVRHDPSPLTSVPLVALKIHCCEEAPGRQAAPKAEGAAPR